MTPGLFVMVSILIGVFALGYYLDWFGLWLSKKEMQEEIDLSKTRMHEMGKVNRGQVTGQMSTERTQQN